MIGTVEYAIAEDRLDEDGELWEPEEEDPSAGRESSAPFMITPYAGRVFRWCGSWMEDVCAKQWSKTWVWCARGVP